MWRRGIHLRTVSEMLLGTSCGMDSESHFGECGYNSAMILRHGTPGPQEHPRPNFSSNLNSIRNDPHTHSLTLH